MRRRQPKGVSLHVPMSLVAAFRSALVSPTEERAGGAATSQQPVMICVTLSPWGEMCKPNNAEQERDGLGGQHQAAQGLDGGGSSETHKHHLNLVPLTWKSCLSPELGFCGNPDHRLMPPEIFPWNTSKAEHVLCGILSMSQNTISTLSAGQNPTFR